MHAWMSSLCMYAYKTRAMYTFNLKLAEINHILYMNVFALLQYKQYVGISLRLISVGSEVCIIRHEYCFNTLKEDLKLLHF